MYVQNSDVQMDLDLNPNSRLFVLEADSDSDFKNQNPISGSRKGMNLDSSCLHSDGKMIIHVKVVYGTLDQGYINHIRGYEFLTSAIFT